MKPQEFDDLLLQTIEDQHLSRNERQLLDQILADEQPDEQKLAAYRQQAFATARAAVTGEEGQKVLNWLEEVVKVLTRPRTAVKVTAEAHFSPGNDCPRRIGQLLTAARKKVDICVFTISDDRISSAIFDAHRRKVPVRIITDNEKLLDAGSDIQAFRQAGIPVKVDRDQYHMHHKFALFDEAYLLTGSYNWTRSAAEYNLENFIITSDRTLVTRFTQAFEQMWKDLKAL